MMNWITIIWSVNAGACLTLAGMHLLVWAKSQNPIANLLFAIAAAAAAANALSELALMHAQTPAQFGVLLRNLHIPLGVLVITLVWFVRCHLRAGRLWLAWLVTGNRIVVLALHLSADPPPLNFREITALHPISFWGETVVVAIGEKNPWTNITHLSGILFLVFVLDAAFSAWRQGDRWRAGVFGVTFGSASVVALILSELLDRGTLPIPFTLSFPFLIILVGIAYELSMDLVRARQLSQELQKSQQRLSLATSAADLGVWDWDIARDDVWVSDTLRERVGRVESERINFDRSIQWVHPDDRESVQQMVRAALEGAGDFEIECRSIAASGAVQWMVIRGRVERDATGPPLRMRGISLDITERKTSEAALRESEARFRATFEQAAVGIAHTSLDGRFLRVNRKFCAIVGYPHDDLLKKDFRRHTHPDDVPADEQDRRRLLQKKIDTATREKRYIRQDGSTVWVNRTASLIRDAAGAPLWFMIVLEDIGSRKMAETELQKQRAELAHVQRVSTVGELAATLAHELSQPLGAILRNAEAGELFLQQQPLDYAEVHAIFRDIQRDDQRATAVIDHLRALLRRREPQYERLSVTELLDQGGALVRTEAQARQTVLRLEILDELPPVWGDRVQLQQVLLNLIMNGMDALDSTPVERRRLIITAGCADPSFVHVAVSDTGPGIAAEQPARLFEPFHTTKARGLGMGLMISRTIVEAHGGRIEAENHPDGGATFRFTVPVAKPESRA